MSSKSEVHRRFIRIQGQRFTKSFSRKADADRWYQEQKIKKEKLEAGIVEVVSKVTLESFSQDWLRTRAVNGQPKSSYQQEEARLRLYVLPEFGNRILDSITTKEWDVFLNDLQIERKLSPATKNRARSMVSKIYNDAIRMGAATKNPISIIPKAKERQTGWDYWHSKEECARYLEFAKNESEMFSLFALLAINTGARVGEILALEQQDINLEKRRIRIWRVFEQATLTVQKRTKGGGERWLGINEPLFEALKQHRARTKFNHPTSPVICDKLGNRPDPHRIRRTHRRVCRKAEIKEVRIHDIRHTFASHFVMAGGSLAELQGLLGHSTPMMTLKYAHLAPGYLESRASVVSFDSSDSVARVPLAIVKTLK